MPRSLTTRLGRRQRAGRPFSSIYSVGRECGARPFQPPLKHWPKARLKAGIVFNRGAEITSVVKNLSESGAMLEVESVIGILDEFTLFVEAEHFKCECRKAITCATFQNS